MAPTPHELSLHLAPLVPESLLHNTRTLSNIRSVSALLLGIAAGILGLQSQYGFLFYLAAQTILSAVFYFVHVGANPQRYFAGDGGSRVVGPKGREAGTGAWREVWLGGGLFTEGLSGFVLGWAGVGGIVR